MDHMAGAFDDNLTMIGDDIVSFLFIPASYLPAYRAVDE